MPMRPTSLVRSALGAAALLSAVVVAPGALGTHVRMRPVSASTVLADTGVGSPDAGAPDLTRYVNPLAGSLGPGFPFVGAALPFAMATPGPATMLPTGPDPVNYVGYGYQDPLISGFALTHFDGAGVHIAGDLPIMATTGSVSSNSPMMFASPFSHASETSQPGYYGVTLSKYDIRAELTATTRVGVMHFEYPAGQAANVLFDTSQNNVGLNLASVAITGENTVSGWMKSTGTGGYRVYFSATFDRDFASFGTWDGSALDPGSASATSSATGAWVSFPASSGPQTVTVRVGLSYTSAAGAADNLAAEAPPSLSFDAIRAAATQTWNEHLHDVVVTGGSTATTETFYTNLYRALLMPSVLNDDDGSYLGLDGQVHQVAVGHEHYTNLSLWDIYRSQVPLIDLVEPAVAQDIATSLLADYDQNHEQFPRWVYANFDLGTMGGDSAMEVLATDLADGVLSGQEASTAYADLVHATTPPASSGNLGVYLDNGYIPFAGASDNRPSSETLSYAIGYGALAQVAQIYGTPAQVQQFSSLSGYWKNLFDPSDRFLRPRNSDGSWANPTSVGPESIFSPDSQDGWQEGTGWQYLWSVPQDVAGLTQAIGGRDATLSRLD
ncbi:MAG: GH92 family glycosyl hydrolase, partial [Acidimicrobiales bacterium]